MPRSHGFDHFNSLQPDVSKGGRPAARSRSGAKVTGHSDVHYGKQFAQTEELYHAHEMEHQLEELAKNDLPPAKTESKETDAKVKAKTVSAPSRSEPIGALPQTEETPVSPTEAASADEPFAVWSEAWKDAAEQARAMTAAARGLGNAGIRLASAPLEMARAFARQLPLVGKLRSV